jgi:DNA-binding response OmpR family regulator
MMSHDNLQENAQTGARLAAARILLVEDELLVAMEIDAGLRDAGAREVTLCGSVKRALASLEQGQFDAAILDIRLGDGFVGPVARRLAERGIPFLFYTGQTMTDPILAEWPGMQVLTKPVRNETIVAALQRLLRQGGN